jgi:predicted AlkP superfamily pyrophosphatase or phosphodiesterase
MTRAGAFVANGGAARAMWHACAVAWTSSVAACGAIPVRAEGQGAAGYVERPTLLVLVAVDQLRADYFERFGRQLRGGLRRLHDGGAFFRRGVHDHAITETAPGHAAMLSGRFPVHTGIALNTDGVNDDPAAPLIGSSDLSASPFRFRGTTLIDWLRSANPETRFLSVSRKDRGAILPVGRSKGHVYWWGSPPGLFTTSRYYADTLPTWVQRFNARKLAQHRAGTAWTLLLPSSSYPEPDSVDIENGGADYVFPHLVPTDSAQAAREAIRFPWMDDMTLAFALEGAQALQLGVTPGRTDVLAVSLSTLDAIGHQFGPDSREVHDHVLRLDRALDVFLDSLETLRGAQRLLVVLTSDHGVAPYPVRRSPRDPNADAKIVSLTAQWRSFRERLAGARVDPATFEFRQFVMGGVIAVRESAWVARPGMNPDSLLVAFAQEARRVDGVLRVDFLTDLARADTVGDVIARRWLHMFEPGGAVRAVITLTPYSYWSWINNATHGSPHDYDANVPIVFWGPFVRAGQYSEVARVVDIAPTVAALLGVTPQEPVDGRVLPQVRP